MTQIALRNLTISHSSLPLIENGNLYIEPGERVCIIGRNGAGKSTLLKAIQGIIEPDKGVIEKSSGLKIALLPQTVPSSIAGTVEQLVSKELKNNHHNGWQDTHIASKYISLLGLDGDAQFNDLSGGMRRLVLLASILAQEPDILMLDEPTNHLDISKIVLLESLLVNFRNTIIFITHDRQLLQRLATHIVEIDNGQLFSWRGHFNAYQNHKETLLEAEARANALFDKKLAEEERWIRQGIKARRTRNEGRVRALKRMREERSHRRTRQGKINITENKIGLSGKIVFEVDNISFSYGNKKIVDDFSTLILRGDKIGIIGPNGVGKSTLINLILGNETPDDGDVKRGTNLVIGYFDQHRLQLDDNKTIYDTIAEISDTITIGNTQKHVMSYLQDFLFSPIQARTLIKNLSGGERNRVMLAKLFAKPCNVLVLDEPTNDLDIETLELLEEQLANFTGTLLLISHDRVFLNNVVTSVLVFGEGGKIEEYVGGYDDWQSHKPAEITKGKSSTQASQNIIKEESSKKLSFKEQRELDSLPGKIEDLEQRQRIINEQLADPESYKNESNKISQLTQELASIEQELAASYNRWQELEERSR